MNLHLQITLGVLAFLCVFALMIIIILFMLAVLREIRIDFIDIKIEELREQKTQLNSRHPSPANLRIELQIAKLRKERDRLVNY